MNNFRCSVSFTDCSLMFEIHVFGLTLKQSSHQTRWENKTNIHPFSHAVFTLMIITCLTTQSQ